LKYATGDVIAVFDADTRVDPDFLRKTVPILYAPEVGGVQGRVRICNARDNLLTQLQDDEFSTFAHMVQISKEFYGGINILAGNGQVTKRSDLEEVGGWNELSATDDLDLTIKLLLNKRYIRYAGDAYIWQEGITHFKPFLRQRIRWAEGMLKCFYDYLVPLLMTRGVPFLQRFDSLAVLARILVPLSIWIGYGQIMCAYLFNKSFTSSFPSFFCDSLPWIFGIVMSGGLLKYVTGASPVTLIRVPIYWLYNLCWVFAVPVGYINCIKNVNRIKWDKTEHLGLGRAPADPAEAVENKSTSHIS
jgi:1,2-diacylglycerol 3-beta-glucosyltransferase